MYSLIVSDVDGTLTHACGEPVMRTSPGVREAVLKVKALGVRFTLATARSFEWIEGLAGFLKINDPLILDNGAVIFDPVKRQETLRLDIPKEKAGEILDIASSFGHQVTVASGEVRYIYEGKKSEDLSGIKKIMILHIEPARAEEIYAVLARRQDIKVTKSISGENPIRESIHITHPKATKGQALREIAESLGIKKEEIIGIGDSYNDLELLSECGLKIAMGNSVPEIKEAADFVVSTLENDGVARALEKFILNGGKA